VHCEIVHYGMHILSSAISHPGTTYKICTLCTYSTTAFLEELCGIRHQLSAYSN